MIRLMDMLNSVVTASMSWRAMLAFFISNDSSIKALPGLCCEGGLDRGCGLEVVPTRAYTGYHHFVETSTGLLYTQNFEFSCTTILKKLDLARAVTRYRFTFVTTLKLGTVYLRFGELSNNNVALFEITVLLGRIKMNLILKLFVLVLVLQGLVT